MENEGEERSRLLVLGESRGVVAVAIGLQGGVQETNQIAAFTDLINGLSVDVSDDVILPMRAHDCCNLIGQSETTREL